MSIKTQHSRIRAPRPLKPGQRSPRKAGSAVLLLLTILLAAGNTLAVIDDASLNRTLDEVRSYEPGDSRAALIDLEEMVAEASADEGAARDVADRLAETLARDDATDDARAYICRQLWIIGGGEQVPTLAEMLDDERLSHMARYALQRIDDPAADEALRQAMNRVDGDLLIGMIHSLGERGDEGSVQALKRRLTENDLDVAEAAAAALGKIGGQNAADAVTDARSNADGRMKQVLTDAALRIAEDMLRSGHQDRAITIYEQLDRDGEPHHVRVAALAGLVAAQGNETSDMLLDLARGDDAEMRIVAVRHLERMDGTQATESLVNLLNENNPAVQTLALEALAAREQTSAESAVAELARESENDRVRAAALDALAGVGSGDSVELLASTAASKQGPVHEAARRALSRLRAGDADKAIADAIDDADERTRAELVRALRERRAVGQSDRVLDLAAEDDAPAVRAEAFQMLADLGSADHLPKLVDLMVKEERDAARSAAERAVASIAAGGDRAENLQPILAAHRETGGKARASTLRVLGRIGGPSALSAVRDDLDSGDETIRDAAARALVDWPDPTAADDLLNLAENAEDSTHRILALRGYIRLISALPDSEWETKLTRYERAAALTDRPEGKRAILSGLSDIPRPEALEMIRRYEDDSAVQAEAEQAARKVQREIEQREDR